MAMEAISAPPGGLTYIRMETHFTSKTNSPNIWKLRPECLIFGNGSHDVLQIVGETYISPGDEVIYSESAFLVYMLVTIICGATSVVTPRRDYAHDLDAMADAITDATKAIFIAIRTTPLARCSRR